MLKIVDNEEFYEQEKPLSLKDLKSLILILKQVYTKQYHQCVIISHPLCWFIITWNIRAVAGIYSCLIVHWYEFNFNLQALWQLLWIIPSHTSSTQKSLPNPLGLKKMSIDNLKSRARTGLSELLIQVNILPLIYHVIVCYVQWFWFSVSV
jgi:ubiquitin-protein ligase E3 C